MAKKKQTKKHKFKYVAPVTTGQTAAAEATTKPAAKSPREATAPVATVAAPVETSQFSYVGGDIRRVGLLAIGLTLLELVLWWAFGHSGLGNAVYNLVHV